VYVRLNDLEYWYHFLAKAVACAGNVFALKVTVQEMTEQWIEQSPVGFLQNELEGQETQWDDFVRNYQWRRRNQRQYQGGGDEFDHDMYCGNISEHVLDQ